MRYFLRAMGGPSDQAAQPGGAAAARASPRADRPPRAAGAHRPGYAMPARPARPGTRHAPLRRRPRPLCRFRPAGRRHPGTAEPLPRQGAGELRPAGWPPHHHRHRPAERLRPDHHRGAAEGPGADPDRPLLVRRAPPTSAPTTSSNTPTRTCWSAAGSTSCRSRWWCGTTWPAPPPPPSCRCTRRAGGRCTATASPTACGRTRSCRRPSSPRPARPSTSAMTRS